MFNLEFLPNYYSCRFLFFFSDDFQTILSTKKRNIFFHQFQIYILFTIIWRICIYKTIHFFAMTMNVKEKIYFLTQIQFFNIIFIMKYSCSSLITRVYISSIQIKSMLICSIIAHYYSINVDHRY